MDKQILIDIIKSNIRMATGCTDPVIIAFSVAKATEILGKIPDKILVTLSPNIYKNAVNVVIPVINKRGLENAASLGVFLSKYVKDELNIFDNLDEEIINNAQKFINGSNKIKVTYDITSPDAVYIKTFVCNKNETATVIIQKNYSNISEIMKNDRIVFSNTSVEESNVPTLSDNIVKYKIKDILETINSSSEEDFAFLIDAAMINKSASLEATKYPQINLGKVFKDLYKNLEFPFSAMMLGKFYTASASEGRMRGLKLPIMTITGSGNKGITNFLGVLAVAEALNSPKDKLAKALALSSAITIYVKNFINEVSAICGCVFASSPGVSAATVYLLGGSYEDMVNAMNTVIGTLAGIICDGAKESCAYRLSTAVTDAIEYGYLATKKKAFHPSSSGIISDNIEDTLANLGRLNSAMKTSDIEVLKLIQEINNHSNL